MRAILGPLTMQREPRRREKAHAASAQLRLLLVTCDPSHPRTQERLSVLSTMLRSAGHTMLVGVPRGSLSPEHADEADDSGVEYIFIPQHYRAFASALGGWRTVLRRFHPNLMHLSADVPPSLALRLATSAQTKASPRISVLVEADARTAQLTAERARARARNREAQKWMTLGLRRATQIVCSDSQTLRWCRETLHLHAFRLSPIGRPEPRVPGGRIGTVLLIAGARESSDHSGTPSLPQMLLTLLLSRDALRVIAHASMRHDLEGPLTGLQGGMARSISGRIAYVNSFSDWLSCLDDDCVVVGELDDPDRHREIGAAQACDIPTILVAEGELTQKTPHRHGVHLVRRGQLHELVEALRLIEDSIEDGDRTRVGAGHTSASIERAETAAEVERLYRIYEGVHVRETAD
jgi:hypothetical protein